MASHKNQARYKQLQKKLKQRGAQPPRQVAEMADAVVRTARRLIDESQLDEARRILEECRHLHPRHLQTLMLLAEVYQEQQANGPYCRVCEQLAQQSPDNPAIHLMVASGYLITQRPIAAWLAFKRFCARWPNDPMAESVQDTLQQIQPMVADMLAAAPFPEKERLELAAMHEEMLACLAWGEFTQLIKLGRELLRRHPGFVPAMNNLSIGYVQTGKTNESLELARQVVELEPHNCHALGNLARGLLVAGREEEAREYVKRLREAPLDKPEVCIKQAETLSFFGDDQGVLEAFRAGEEAGYTAGRNPDTAHLFHFAAVALARQGDWQQARKYWRQALSIDPKMERAEENLADAKRPAAEREGPWAHALQSWIPLATIERLRQHFADRSGSDEEAAAICRFAQEHPEIARLAPHLLDRGDPAARQFSIHYAEQLDTPALRSALMDFCQSQRGSDEQRRGAAMWLSQKGAIPSRRVRMWVDGQWRELELMGFEISSEPTGPQHSGPVDEWAAQALQALRNNDGKLAEKLLQKCLAIEPDKPDLLNNLAAACQLQGRMEEGRALMRQIHERWPDYCFGRIALAHMAIAERDYPKAEALIEPLRQASRLHITEFDALAQVYVRLFMSQGKPDAARSWWEMLKKCSPDHPALPAMERGVTAGSLLDRFSRWLLPK